MAIGDSGSLSRLEYFRTHVATSASGVPADNPTTWTQAEAWDAWDNHTLPDLVAGIEPPANRALTLERRVIVASVTSVALFSVTIKSGAITTSAQAAKLRTKIDKEADLFDKLAETGMPDAPSMAYALRRASDRLRTIWGELKSKEIPAEYDATRAASAATAVPAAKPGQPGGPAAPAAPAGPKRK